MAKKDEMKIDGRSLPDTAMDYIRKMAVRAVEEKGYSLEVVIDIFGLSRSCIYTWLHCHRAEGPSGLEARHAPGKAPVLTAEMESWLREVILESTPVARGYDRVLWMREMLAELLEWHFGVKVSGRTVSGHLKRMGLSDRQPSDRAQEQDPAEVEHYR